MDDLQELTLKVYDTVADDRGWAEALDHLVDRIGAQGCILFEWADIAGQRRLTTPFHSSFYTADGLSVYLQKCAHLESRDQDALRANTSAQDPIDLVDDTVLARSKTELENQEHMKTLSRFGIFHRAAGVLNKDNKWLSLFSVQLKASRGPLDEGERHYMAQLLPHFAKAVDLGVPMRQLNRQRSGILAAVNQLSIGICILDSAGLVVEMNEEFRRQRDSYKAFRVTQNGKLEVTDPTGQAEFSALMSAPQSHGKFGARPRKEAISADGEDNFLCLELSPLTRSDEIGSALFSGFILTSTDTTRAYDCNIAPLEQAFGLTKAELSLAEAIGQGLTNPQIADRRERSVSTVNAQVKSILSKTQCATRTQFVRMMMRFGANFLVTPS